VGCQSFSLLSLCSGNVVPPNGIEWPALPRSLSEGVPSSLCGDQPEQPLVIKEALALVCREWQTTWPDLLHTKSFLFGFHTTFCLPPARLVDIQMQAPGILTGFCILTLLIADNISDGSTLYILQHIYVSFVVLVFLLVTVIALFMITITDIVVC
jgi:hypothetical protein